MECSSKERCCSIPAKLTTHYKRQQGLILNWLFLFVLGGLYAVSYTSISSSFHQFVTNPSIKDLNGSNSTVETGLGQSEEFYSALISLFNIGAFTGAIACGLLLKITPYWHLILGSLVAHTVGYIIYGVTNIGWLIMVSKFLSGVFIGAELTLALSYFAESSVEYRNLRQEAGNKTEFIFGTRESLFAWHNIGINIGYIFGPGFAVVLAQFEVDQFRSIAWYNVALGIICILLLLIMFRENGDKATLNKFRACFSSAECHKCKMSCDGIELFIIFFLITLRGVLSFRFGAYETVYNPVLSDYFGFTEKESSYYFFALTIAQISGTVILICLQRFNVSTPLIAIIGLLLTLASALLMTDWQAIPFDQCTNFSPFHHPELATNNSSLLASGGTRIKSCSNTLSTLSSPTFLNFSSTSSLHLDTGNVDIPMVRSLPYKCRRSKCHHRCHKGDFTACVYLHTLINPLNCRAKLSLELSPLDIEYDDHICKTKFSSFSMCVMIANESESADMAKIQKLQGIRPDIYETLVDNCLHANTTYNDCHWNPYSKITGKICNDCQPICRSAAQSLTFPQFIIGSALLLISIPIAWVPVATLLSERVSPTTQGFMMGVMVGLTAIGRSFSPLWLDAAYEGMQKRTFLAMLLLSASHLPFLVGIIVLYRKFKGTGSQ